MRAIAPAVLALTRRIQCMRVRGSENIPASGPFLLVSNHTCHLDALSVAVPVYEAGRVPRIAGRADLFTVPVLGWALRRLDQIPIYRSDVAHVPRDGGTPASSLRAMSAVLEAGGGVIVFPESTFTRDPSGWPMRAKTGVARLALAHPEAAVVPVAHWGNEAMLDPWSNRVDWRRIGRARTTLDVRIGEPLDLARFRGREVTHELLTELTEAVMAAITQELEVLRADDVAAGLGPRDPRWDRRRDGDPFERRALQRSEQLKKRLDRKAARGKWRKATVEPRAMAYAAAASGGVALALAVARKVAARRAGKAR
ncbi:MAG: lysophospholipid acyltransferase family protein [Actinomycetaceae bacterium]|nr:lysophospholipid acyltransferase family protein [Actinomycetaceae bacterium]